MWQEALKVCIVGKRVNASFIQMICKVPPKDITSSGHCITLFNVSHKMLVKAVILLA